MNQPTEQTSSKKEISVVIIAGGKGNDALTAGLEAEHPALIEIGGRSIISRTVEAFQGVPEMAEVVVVSVPEVLKVLPAGVRAIEAGGKATDNIASGLRACSKEWVVVAPADMPWLSAEVISEFLSSALAAEADMVYPIVSQSDYDARFRGGRRTYVHLREGRFTGGNIVLAKRAFLENLLPFIRRLFEYRKNPLLLARALGLGFVLRMLLRQLDIPSIEARALQLTGGRAIALPIPRAELAFDIDKPEDLQAAREMSSPPENMGV